MSQALIKLLYYFLLKQKLNNYCQIYFSWTSTFFILFANFNCKLIFLTRLLFQTREVTKWFIQDFCFKKHVRCVLSVSLKKQNPCFFFTNTFSCLVLVGSLKDSNAFEFVITILPKITLKYSIRVNKQCTHSHVNNFWIRYCMITLTRYSWINYIDQCIIK